MFRTQRKSRDRRLLEQSIEREKGWKQLLEEREAQLAKTGEQLNEALANADRLANFADSYAERAAIAARQAGVAQARFDGLAQRFVGFKVAVGGILLRDACVEHRGEVSNLSSELASAANQVAAEFEQRRTATVSNGEQFARAERQ